MIKLKSFKRIIAFMLVAFTVSGVMPLHVLANQRQEAVISIFLNSESVVLSEDNRFEINTDHFSNYDSVAGDELVITQKYYIQSSSPEYETPEKRFLSLFERAVSNEVPQVDLDSRHNKCCRKSLWRTCYTYNKFYRRYKSYICTCLHWHQPSDDSRRYFDNKKCSKHGICLKNLTLLKLSTVYLKLF
ncbi:MAG: hypothetical protein FWF50_04180 [Defluviitaleaceae bacterium]|nr:hypothetical protein [Defluviitaleaceae bacterium]